MLVKHTGVRAESLSTTRLEGSRWRSGRLWSWSRDLPKRRGAQLEQSRVHTRAVPRGHGQERIREREDDVHIRHREQVPPRRSPAPLPGQMMSRPTRKGTLVSLFDWSRPRKQPWLGAPGITSVPSSLPGPRREQDTGTHPGADALVPARPDAGLELRGRRSVGPRRHQAAHAITNVATQVH